MQRFSSSYLTDKSKFETQHHGYAPAKYTHKQVGTRIARPLKTPMI
jgi:hypothetical protein